jgi:N-acetylmuramic acid 6-phosphate etherase
MIVLHEDEIEWDFRNLNWRIPRSGKGLLFDHLLVKMLLNIHSTLLMGRMGRFESNFMTYVLPTNGKLVDRASRYVKWLLSNRGAPVPPDEVVVTELFRQLENLGDQESVVIKTADALSR